jgi:hypothetical protein
MCLVGRISRGISSEKLQEVGAVNQDDGGFRWRMLKKKTIRRLRDHCERKGRFCWIAEELGFF